MVFFIHWVRSQLNTTLWRDRHCSDSSIYIYIYLKTDRIQFLYLQIMSLFVCDQVYAIQIQWCSKTHHIKEPNKRKKLHLCVSCIHTCGRMSTRRTRKRARDTSETKTLRDTTTGVECIYTVYFAAVRVSELSADDNIVGPTIFDM